LSSAMFISLWSPLTFTSRYLRGSLACWLVLAFNCTEHKRCPGHPSSCRHVWADTINSILHVWLPSLIAIPSTQSSIFLPHHTRKSYEPDFGHRISQVLDPTQLPFLSHFFFLLNIPTSPKPLYLPADVDQFTSLNNK
jgi:hypothetical protein